MRNWGRSISDGEQDFHPLDPSSAMQQADNMKVTIVIPKKWYREVKAETARAGEDFASVEEAGAVIIFDSNRVTSDKVSNRLLITNVFS